ncbi:hypothetical protein AB0M95_31535 [Sphaerisporangium sp. NPDC051017]|uniref:hypothetical protein n=1 Tax=unclassified Sphaerisporangium TaxID=2630420 RepID=UPI0033C1A3DC
MTVRPRTGHVIAAADGPGVSSREHAPTQAGYRRYRRPGGRVRVPDPLVVTNPVKRQV